MAMMENAKMLTGYDLVSKGTTKLEKTLPELGLKDIFPNGSWIEQKQIQAALEARKHLIEVERIEKSGVLSHAVWREELMLAEVTQKVGGYWQYFGHNKGKQLFLNPEEALFLMEINCLHLIHNDIKVSLQQAYALLLRGNITHLEYKVYASLSRLGYRVFRHQILETNRNKSTNKNKIPYNEGINVNPNIKEDGAQIVVKDENNSDSLEDLEECDTKNNSSHCDRSTMDFTVAVSLENKIKHKNICIVKRLEKLQSRKLKPCNSERLYECFQSIPTFLNKSLVNIKVADKKYLPEGLNLSKSVYCMNLLRLHRKFESPPVSESNRYSPDEVNGSHIRRLRNTSYTSSYSNPTNQRFGLISQDYQRPYFYWRQRSNFNYFNSNIPFQRPFLPNILGLPPVGFLPRPQLFRHTYPNHRNRKRNRSRAQIEHLEVIKSFTMRLKNLFQYGHPDRQKVDALQKIITTYNIRYKTNLRLSDDLDLIMEEVVDTIDLDDDEPVSKKRHVEDTTGHLQNLSSLKAFAAQLKDLEKTGKSSPRHRRAFTKLLKKFNQSYNEEYYLMENYEIGNKKHITLDTSDSSHSDCIIEDTPNFTVGKIVKNPFNVLKRLSEQTEFYTEASTSREENNVNIQSKPYSRVLLQSFSSEWLPNTSDFGRAEIVQKAKTNDLLLDISQEEFLYDFVKIQPCKSNDWLSLKKSYFNTINEAVPEFQNSMEFNVNSIVKPNDCSNMAAVLKKLSIIKTEKEGKEDCNLVPHFDVYNRDVQCFKKTNPPSPHFRIICLSESSNMPSGDEIAALHSKYEDNVAIVFAIVGDSTTYVQVNATDIPVYISNNT